MEIHGGNIYDKKVELDFSVNVNPFGMPASVQEAAIRGVQEAARYPDIEKRALTDALAAHHHMPGGRILTGNGAAELIYAAAAGIFPRRACVIGPTFVEYGQALEACGCQTDYILTGRENGYRITAQTIERVEHLAADSDKNGENIEMLFLCNPNNPTGTLADRELLKRLFAICKERGIYVCLDECFMEFTERADQDSWIPCLEEYPHLLILKAFTKLYAMPGLRLGYMLTGDEETAAKIRRMLPPWNVSAPAQAAGTAALKETAFAKETSAWLLGERQRVSARLEEIGYKVWDSDTIFFLFEGGEDLQKQCLRRGIYIRDAASFPGIAEGTYRIGVKKREDNDRLLKALEELAEQEKKAWQK